MCMHLVQSSVRAILTKKDRNLQPTHKMIVYVSIIVVIGGKTQVMGEIKVALKKEVKTEGDQLVLEILQCRNITYKFKSPDHLPGLEVLCSSAHA